MKPFIKETVREALAEGKYSFKMYLRGMRGLVSFFRGLVVKGDQKSYACTDSSRWNFCRLVEIPKNWMTDKNGKFLNECLDMPEFIELLNRYDREIDKETDLELRDAKMTSVKPISLGFIFPDSQERIDMFRELRKELGGQLSIDNGKIDNRSCS
jgi:hypothetical protein